MFLKKIILHLTISMFSIKLQKSRQWHWHNDSYKDNEKHSSVEDIKIRNSEAKNAKCQVKSKSVEWERWLQTISLIKG